MKIRYTGLALSSAVVAVSFMSAAMAQIADASPAASLTSNGNLPDLIEGLVGPWLGPLFFLACIAAIFAHSGLSWSWPTAPVGEQNRTPPAGNDPLNAGSGVVQLSAYRVPTSSNGAKTT